MSMSSTTWKQRRMVILLTAGFILITLSWNLNIRPSLSFPTKQQLVFRQAFARTPSQASWLWPAPSSSRSGELTLTLSKVFRISPSRKLATLHYAIQRYLHLILFSSRHIKAPSSKDYVLDQLHVEVDSANENLQLGVDESYLLQVPHASNPRVALLQAKTVYGALRGLETFSQLCTYNASTKTIQVQSSPWRILDKPRFAYRGLMIDTSRHYLPVSAIRKVLDSMSYSKFNILHWHIVDEEAFPLEIPSFPHLWTGAYSSQERYTIEDAKGIVEYARQRGINVMPEIDVPGHARSWGYGYPKLWPSRNCTTPLDVSSEFTFKVIEGILSDLSKVFPFKLFHLGGDEVAVDCWGLTDSIPSWLDARNMTLLQGYEYFVLRVQKMAMKYGYIPVNWQEVFKNFGSSLHRETIVHNWWGLEIAPEVVQAGLKCIVSEQMSWYLDHEKITWQKFYVKDPFENITDEHEQKLVIGGEVCMWGERVDSSNIEQRIWPRAAAAAERLWSPRNVTGVKDAEKRLQRFRCVLNERGVAAAPVHLQYPNNTGSCFTQ